MNFRKAALEALSQWDTTRRFASTVVDEVCQRANLSPRDRSALQRLVFSAIRNDRLLDFWARRFARGKLDPRTLRLIKMGLAEVLLLEEHPHAAISETVNLAGWAKGLVNGILRNAARESASLRAERETLPPGLRWSLPDFLWERWCSQHGADAALNLCRWNHLPAPVYLRLNPLKSTPDQVRCSPQLRPLDAHPGFWELEGPLPLEWVRQGWVYAQDPSTHSAIDLLAPEPGQRVLDACASPGGKSFAIAIRTRNQATLTAADQNLRRLRLMADNFQRLAVQARILQADWTAGGSWQTGEFDRILLDVPCSNTGVIRRRIDVPHRLRASDFETLIPLQETLLRALAARLAPGGRLVYSTCSIDCEEGHLLVDRFLRANPDLHKVSDAYTRPWLDRVDGTYAAAIEKKG